MDDHSFYTSDEKMPIFMSEEIEPFAAMCTGRWYARCEAARKVKEEIEERCKAENREMTFNESLDCQKFFRECNKWWWGMNALNKVSIVTEGAVHFSIAIGNIKRKVASYIKEYLGFCPITEEDKAIECGFIIK